MSARPPRTLPPLVPVLLALAVTLLLGALPVVGALVFPLRLFVTLIHESGHAVAALATGGHVEALRVDPNGGGHVLYRGTGILAAILVSSAGYLGAVGYGALLLTLARRAATARVALGGSALLLGALTLFFGFPNPVTLLVGLAAAAALGWLARRGRDGLILFVAAFLGVRCVVSGWSDLTGLLVAPRLFGAPVNDATILAGATGVPALVWALLWSLLALGALGLTARSWWPRRGTAAPARDGAGALPTSPETARAPRAHTARPGRAARAALGERD